MKTTIPTSWALYIIFICSFIILFLPTRFFVSPTKTTDSTSWSTYTNIPLGFSLRYPPSWVVSDSGADIYLKPLIPDAGNTLSIYISSQANLPSVPLTSTKIGQLEAYYTDATPTSPEGTLVYIFPRSGTRYLAIGFSPYNANHPTLVQKENFGIFTEILHSLELKKVPIIQIGQPTPSVGCYYLQVQCVSAPCDPVLVCPRVSPTCRPRPACFDATPPCMIPETDDMCPPSTSTQNDWQVYTNSKAGFSFEYRVEPGYSTETTSSNDHFSIVMDGPVIFPYFGVSTFLTTEEPLDWWSTKGKTTNYRFDKQISVEKITFAQKEAIQIKGQWQSPGGDMINGEVLLISNNGYLVLVSDYNPSIIRNFIFKNYYSCPSSEYVDCMPGPGEPKPRCQKDYLDWMQENCPSFQGVAY